MAKDLVGKELVIGSRVAYCLAGSSQNMRVSTVTKLSPKTVTVEATNDWGGVIRRSHSAVVVV